MEIFYMSVDELRENPLNVEMYGEPDEEEVALLALDITERGIRQPLVVTPEGVVVSGHRRLAAAKLAGLAEVPCILQDNVDDARMALEMTLDNAPRKRPFTQLMAHALMLRKVVQPILKARQRHEDPSGLPGYELVAPVIKALEEKNNKQ